MSDRAALAVRIETAAALTEGLARRIMADDTDNDGLAAALVTRFAVQDAIAADRATRRSRLLGGMAYVNSSRRRLPGRGVARIAFHPPSRSSSAGGLLDYYPGYPMVVS